MIHVTGAAIGAHSPFRPVTLGAALSRRHDDVGSSLAPVGVMALDAGHRLMAGMAEARVNHPSVGNPGGADDRHRVPLGSDFVAVGAAGEPCPRRARDAGDRGGIPRLAIRKEDRVLEILAGNGTGPEGIHLPRDEFSDLGLAGDSEFPGGEVAILGRQTPEEGPHL